MGNAGRKFNYEFQEGLKFFYSKLCLPYLICQFHKDEQGGDSITRKVALVRDVYLKKNSQKYLSECFRCLVWLPSCTLLTVRAQTLWKFWIFSGELIMKNIRSFTDQVFWRLSQLLNQCWPNKVWNIFNNHCRKSQTSTNCEEFSCWKKQHEEQIYSLLPLCDVCNFSLHRKGNQPITDNTCREWGRNCQLS